MRATAPAEEVRVDYRIAYDFEDKVYTFASETNRGSLDASTGVFVGLAHVLQPVRSIIYYASPLSTRGSKM